jgi:hypothetical protein
MVDESIKSVRLIKVCLNKPSVNIHVGKHSSVTIAIQNDFKGRGALSTFLFNFEF